MTVGLFYQLTNVIKPLDLCDLSYRFCDSTRSCGCYVGDCDIDVYYIILNINKERHSRTISKQTFLLNKKQPKTSVDSKVDDWI